MSFWQEYDLEMKITQILEDVPEYAPHHLGYPNLTAYQIAIEFNHRYPDIVAQLGYPIGGAGTGQQNSLAQYIARELSRRINTREITQIEGGFISNWHLNDISFDNQGEIIHSSLTGTAFTLSMFRYKDD